MAYRFLREGLYTRRQSLRHNGFTPFIDDLMWEATDWHYQHYIRRVARASLLTHQDDINTIVDQFISARQGALAKGTNRLYLRIATPNIVPYRRQSNPFCRHSCNHTGWQLCHRRLERYPRPYRSRKLGGTDLTVPVMPKH